MRKAIKLICKIAALPVAAAMTLIQWILIFLNSISGVITGILSGLFCLVGIAGLLFGIVSGPECLRMLIIGFILFVIPHIGNWITERILSFRCCLSDFIRS